MFSLCHIALLNSSYIKYCFFMEMDQSVNNDESQRRNVYGSLIDQEIPENSEGSDSEVGDKSTCKLVGISYGICRMK